MSSSVFRYCDYPTLHLVAIIPISKLFHLIISCAFMAWMMELSLISFGKSCCWLLFVNAVMNITIMAGFVFALSSVFLKISNSCSRRMVAFVELHLLMWYVVSVCRHIGQFGLLASWYFCVVSR